MTTPSDLIEEVATVLLQKQGYNVETLRKHCMPAWLLACEDARATAIVIIEACAKVAENTTSEFEEGYRMAAIFAATNIRALAAKPEGA